MKTIMFAGADSMTDFKASEKAVQIPEVQKKLAEYDLLLNLDKHLMNMLKNPFPAMFASVLTQIGLFQNFIKNNPGRYILTGCSLGDLAKLVSAGVIHTDTVAEGLELFCKGLKEVPKGSIMQVRTTKKRDAAFFDSLKEHNIYMAVDQTPHHCLISGEDQNLTNWQKSREALSTADDKTTVKLLFPYPLHSPLMAKPYELLEKILFESPMNHPQMNLVSSTEAQFISGTNEIREDLKKNILGEVKWQKTYSWLADQVNVTEFINIGPILTLKMFGERIITENKVALFDSLEKIVQLDNLKNGLVAAEA